MTSNLYCDNYRTCNGIMMAQGSEYQTESMARAKGWHIYKGVTIGGEEHVALLCGACASPHRRLPKAPAVLPGQQELIEIRVIVDKS